MHYLKYFFIIILFIGCNDKDPERQKETQDSSPTDTSEPQEPPPTETLSPELQLAECIGGIYVGSADFVYNRFAFNSRNSEYLLEVAHSGNNAQPEILFVLTNIYENNSTGVVCTSIPQPVFDASSSLLSGNLFHSGQAPLETSSHTIGIDEIQISAPINSIEGSDETTLSDCEISSFSLIRTQATRASDAIKEVFTISRSNDENSRRSFDELKEVCNSLTPFGKADVSEEVATTQPSAQPSAQPEEIDLQNPTQ